MINANFSDFEKLYPEANYDRKEWSFSKEELQILNTYHAIKTMGEMAGTLIDQLLNAICLPRVGYTAKKGMGTIYDHAKGTFTVFTPKFWCELCKDKPATMTYDKRKYCEQCLALVQIKESVDREKEGNTIDAEVVN